MALISFVIAILATYRLAHLLPEDEGPLFVFARIRNYGREKAIKSYCVANSFKDKVIEITFEPGEVTTQMLLSDDNRDLGLWANIFKGITCVYCCGIYAALLVALLVVWNNFYGNLFLLVFAIAGGQTLLQKLGDR